MLISASFPRLDSPLQYMSHSSGISPLHTHTERSECLFLPLLFYFFEFLFVYPLFFLSVYFNSV